MRKNLVMACYRSPKPAEMCRKTVITLLLQCFLFLVIDEFSMVNSTSEVLRPRGVAISKASLYDPNKAFTCLDGSRTIPFNQVNDDYCDCPDASDEPGTSACPTGFFHCTNAGHRPLNIPSSRVNDGICDCCDTSDEYASSAKCVNTCTELGKSARAAAQRQAELAKQGNELRLQLIRQGKELKIEKQNRIEQLKKDQDEASKIKQEKESLKNSAEELENAALDKYRKAEEEEKAKKEEESAKNEEQEAFEHFQRLDSDQDQLIRMADLQSQSTFDMDRNGEVSEHEAKFFLGGEEQMDWSSFLTQGWPRMKPYLMAEKGHYVPYVPPPSDRQIDKPGDNAEEFPAENDDEEEEEEEEAPEEEANHEDDGTNTEDKPTEDVPPQEPIPEEPQYDEETQQLIESARKARNEYDDAERALRDVEREIRDIEDTLNRDLGPDEEFAALQGQCFEFTDREYTYKLCPFDQVSQIPRSGGSDTRLGSWGQWSGNPNKYSTMLYDRGQSCWNGPQRTATVNLVCGLENALTSASEPNRCEYLFEFKTPAICHYDSKSNSHDEL